jgi:hypothetical protein
VGGSTARVESAKLAGESIAFSATAGGVRYEFSGRIYNHAIEGQARIIRGKETQEVAWSAARTEIWEPRHASLTTEQALKEIH